MSKMIDIQFSYQLLDICFHSTTIFFLSEDVSDSHLTGARTIPNLTTDYPLWMTLHLPRVGRYSRRSCQWRKQRDRCDTISLARTTLSGRSRGCNCTRQGNRQYKLLATQILPSRYPFVEETRLTSALVAMYEWRCRLFRILGKSVQLFDAFPYGEQADRHFNFGGAFSSWMSASLLNDTKKPWYQMCIANVISSWWAVYNGAKFRCPEYQV